MNPLIQTKTRIVPLLITFVLGCSAFSPRTHARGSRASGTVKTLKLILLTFLIPIVAQAYTALYVIGDSLSDTGNNALAAADASYWHGHYSNGPMWPEMLSTLLGITYSQANNKAFAGSATFDQTGYPGIMTQINTLPPTIPSTALCVLWIGTNDLQYAFNLYWVPGEYATIASQAMTNISNAVGALYARGVRTLVVPNAYDVTITPNYHNYQVPYWQSYFLPKFSSNTTDFNSRLSTLLSNLQATYPAMTIIKVDTRGQLNNMFSHSSSYDLIAGYSIGWDDATFLSTNDFWIGEKYFTWDGFHPTSKMQRSIAAWIYNLVK